MYSKNKLPKRFSLAALLMLSPMVAYPNTGTILSQGEIRSNETEQVARQARTETGAWTTYAGLHPNTDVLVNAIAAAESHGLNPDSYQLSSIQQELESYVQISELAGSYRSDSTIQQRTILEQNLNQAFKQFSRDLGAGVLNALKTQPGLHRAAPTVDTDALLAELHSGMATVHELLKALTPSDPAYAKLVGQMEVLLNERDSGFLRAKVPYAEGVAVNTQHNLLLNLRTRLKQTGDLASDSRMSTLFDAQVEDALKAVQERNGLTVNGKLSERTVVALNASVDEDIQQVAMNLERWRWMPRELGNQHIMVNVPSYELRLISEGERMAKMAVVVGSEEHKTPIFSEDAQSVVVAPTWTVPSSITNKELIPLELKQPGYLESQQFDFFQRTDNGLVAVPRSHVSEFDFHTKPFPYVLQQRAGNINALGRIKILMPNRFAVYMHDTQAKSLFAKTDRAFSHGCIRLSEPLHLGSLILQLDGRSSEETAALLERKKTKHIALTNKVPTHLTYFTAWVDDEGQLHKRRDVYRYNKPLLSGLQDKNTLLSTLQTRPVSVVAEQEAF